MKKIIFLDRFLTFIPCINGFNCIIIFGFLSASLLFGQKITFQITNPSAFSRQNETIEIEYRYIANSFPIDSTTFFLLLDKTNRTYIPLQIIDLDGNGQSDLFIFQTDLKKNQTKLFELSITKTKQDKFHPMTYGLFAVPREDFAWENDNIAYRMYGPAMASTVNNGVDVWCKRVDYPIVAKWYKEAEGSQPGHDPYHLDRGEGADFFSVGRSLGAGGSSIYYQDSMYQSGVFAHWRKIADGPIRVMFELTYENISVGGMKIKERRRISLDAGNYLNKMEVTYFIDTVRMQEKFSFAAGIVKRNGVQSYEDQNDGFITLWGPTNDDPINGYLGTACVVPKIYFLKTTEKSNQLFIIGKSQLLNSYTYYSGAAWSKHPSFSNANEWNNYVRQFAKGKAEPLAVTIKN